ncbi:MAG: FHA domain-containing protein, partial [Phycisphaerales bacterium]|nr:FHA domain-containing protein [Phycisphaerales bacterium]
MDVALVMSRSDGAQRTFPLRKDRIVVGRTSSCDLRIPLSSVSRQHCEIIKGDEQVRLRDLGSSNGTFCNDKRVQEVVLAAGDHLMIGTVQFQVVIDGQPELPSTPVLRNATPNSRSGRTAAGMASPASRKDRSGAEQDREGATVG